MHQEEAMWWGIVAGCFGFVVLLWVYLCAHLNAKRIAQVIPPFCRPGDPLPFEVEDTVCDLCGSASQQLLFVKKDRIKPQYSFRVVRCRDCPMAYVSPRPTLESLPFFYPPEFYAEMDSERSHASYRARLRYMGTASSMLDIGCGRGDFPRFLTERGWAVEGWERLCPSILPGVAVHTGPLGNLVEARRQYELITSWAVFEHLTAPSEYFRLVSQLLRPGGRFVFLVTNIESPASSVLLQEDVPRHMQFFSPAACDRYLKRFGMRMRRVHHTNDVFTIGYPFALEWLRCKLTGQYFDPTELQYRSTAPLYNLTDKVLGRLLKWTFQIVRGNGIIIVEAEKPATSK